MGNDNKIYTIEIAGTNETFTVEDLTINGTNYVSETKVMTKSWPSVFKLTVKDEEGNTTEHYDHAKLIQQVTYTWDKGKWYLAFAPVSQQEYAMMQQQSQIEYIAMMADVEL